MHWDGSISVGNLIETISIIVAVVSAQTAMHAANKRRIQKIEFEVGLMFGWFQKHVIKGSIYDGSDSER